MYVLISIIYLIDISFLLLSAIFQSQLIWSILKMSKIRTLTVIFHQISQLYCDQYHFASSGPNKQWLIIHFLINYQYKISKRHKNSAKPKTPVETVPIPTWNLYQTYEYQKSQRYWPKGNIPLEFCYGVLITSLNYVIYFWNSL